MAQPHQTPMIPDIAGQPESFRLPLSRGLTGRTILWAVAGFDPSSGAGVTADLMTFAAHGIFGCSAITALTVQTSVGVFGWEPVSPALVAETLNRLDEDLPCDGTKIGMLGSLGMADAVAEFLRRKRSYAEGNQGVVVLDPVLRSSSGRSLFPEDRVRQLHVSLLPCVDWITPNWAELELLSGETVGDVASAEQAARQLLRRYPRLHIVATGGDQRTPRDLLLRPDGTVAHLEGERIETTSTHGTGCAFSSALLCALVLGAEPLEAVTHAKAFVEQALRSAPGLGRGKGPMGLLWPLQRS